MEKYKAYALEGVILALIAMFAVKLISPYISKYFEWAGSFGTLYLIPFLIYFVTLLLASIIIKKVWSI